MYSLELIDYLVIAAILLSLIGVGLYFTKKGGEDMDSFFVSGRSLPWYIGGTSMIATSFAADTPLWVSALVRSHGVHYIWQFWAPVIGSVLAFVYFGRKWRRMAFVTVLNLWKLAMAVRRLRLWSGAWGAIIICPLISAWVIKAMETIGREAVGLPPESQVMVTVAVVTVALLMCGLSGLFGVVYTDFIQFILATVGTILLAVLSVKAVGGLDMMVEKVKVISDWGGTELSIAPRIGSGDGEMSVWNAIGYFGFLWIGVGLCGAYQAQRLLASKDVKNAAFAQMLHTVFPMKRILYLFFAVSCMTLNVFAAPAETLPPLQNGVTPQTHAELWADFDPRAEPLDVEVLHEWEEDGVVLQVLRYRVGIFKGEKAMVAAVYGYPKDGKNLPGLVNIHGGGQYADYRACLTNAKRGYATITIAWAGRIHAPDYRVSPAEVKLFWDHQTEDPNYKLTTDWGALDGYHAPSKNGQDAFPSIPTAEWTLDAVESPRNNSWFLGTLAARRALTFLEQQPQVDGDCLGVYGHSMGGKYTVLTAGSDDRVKAAAPSCGGISDRFNAKELHRNTVGDGPSLSNITCPILFLSPSNDFHGRINDLPPALQDLGTKEWRITSSPHHNHQDTAEYEVASQLWFDQQLKGTFQFPQTPQFAVTLSTKSGVPTANVQVDASKPVLSVDVYYTQQGQIDGAKDDRNNTQNRFWRHVKAIRRGNDWVVEMPLISTDLPLWAYANVSYQLEQPVTSAGYYYGVRTANQFVLSSVLQMASPAQLKTAGVQATLKPSMMIETFEGEWQQEWFNYRDGWARSTHKVYDPQWQAPAGAKLALQVSSAQANKLVVKVDDYAAELTLTGGSAWEPIELAAGDFKNVDGQALTSFEGIKELCLSPQESLRGKAGKVLQLGAPWQGADPVFNDLHWVAGQAEAKPAVTAERVKGQPHTMWTYKEIDGKELQLSVFLPEGYETSNERFPTFVVYHGGSWAVGEANWHYPDCEYWASRGMIAVSVDYRLSKRDGVKVPLECVKDAKSAVRYLRKNAAHLKVDPDKMVIAGGSAGGQLAAAMATIDSPETNDDAYDLSISCVPNAVILYNPYFKCEASLSPPNFLRPGLPPFITFLGSEDPAITVESIVDFHNELKAHGGASEFYVGKGGKHGLCNGRNPRNPYFYWSLELSDQFLVKHGILSGESLVARPAGVKVLQPQTDYDSYR